MVGGLATLIENNNLVQDFSNRRIDAFPGERRQRSAIGVREDGTVILAYSFCSLSNMAEIMNNLDCTDAANLDSGRSRAFWHKDKYYKKSSEPMYGVLVGVRR